MLQDTRTDEQLVLAYQSGESGASRRDKQAIATLINRYLLPLKFFLIKLSWYKDDGFLDDILQQTFFIVAERINTERFSPAGPGTVRAFLYQTARNICLWENEQHARQGTTIADVCTDEERELIDNDVYQPSDESKDYGQIDAQLEQIRRQLTSEEQYLMELVSQGKTYVEIQQDQLFSKFSIDYLMRKVYLIRQKVKNL
ncbi:MAG: sigma-70 family RNA polymerase sigma factor [Planctomycetes bacterium]|nr:sigma-70 family RNA polymerase sigma factor [Planctomycetota bacterium]